MSEKEKEVTIDVPAEAPVEAPKEEVVVEIPKPVEVKPEPTAITLPEEEGEGPGLAPVGNGAIGSTTVKAKKKAAVEEVKPEVKEMVALFSTKNWHWAENGGALKRGYNIVDKAKADKWLTLAGVRIATPEEVAKAFDTGR